MAVPAGPTEVGYTGNGITSVFPVPFLVIQATDLAVYVNGVRLISGYTQSGVGNPTSTVTFTSAPANLSKILFQLDVPFERLNDYQENGDFLSSTVNRDFDRIWQALKQLLRFSSRALTLGQFDVDGQGWYRAKNNGIRDLRDPVENQDAVTKRYNELYIAGVIAGATGPINNAANVAYIYPDSIVRSVQSLATNNDPLLGAAGIAFRGRTVYAKLAENLTAEDFGALGDGVTDDSAALYAMHSAVGFIRLKRRTYFLGDSFFSIVAEKVCIIGERKAAFNNAGTQAVDGTGTILLGSILLRADHMYCSDFTADVSRFPTKKEGMVTDARVGQVGLSCILERLGSIARPDADSSHGLLVEGFATHTITDIDVANHNYGVVSKSREGFISRVRGRNVKTAVVYPKSSLPSVGGDVADASVNNIEIRDVQGRGGISDYGCAVWIHAEGVAAVNIRVSGAYYLGGLCAVRVTGAASVPYVVDCSISNVTGTQNSAAAVLVSGSTYDTRINGVTADNPASGLAVSIDASSANWMLDNVMLTITDSAITGTSPATLLGTGQWDNFSVRNAFRTMYVTNSWSTQRTGKKYGQIAISGEGAMTLSGGATTVAGEAVPAVVTAGDNMIGLAGVIGVASVTATGTIASAGTGISLGGGKFYICAATKTDNTQTTFPVYVSAGSVALFAVPTGIKQIYLDSILVRR